MFSLIKYILYFVVLNVILNSVFRINPILGYVIYFGKDPDKLYGSIMVFGKNEYFWTGADRTDEYYFQVEAFNANGISERSQIFKSE